MPELPEVETTRRYLAKKIIGKRIKKVRVLSPKQFIGDAKEIEGLKITSLQRKAKILIWQLEKGVSLLIHLKLTGQLVYAQKLKGKRATLNYPIPFSGGNTLPGRTTRIIIFLNQGAVFFNDLRKFGWIKVVKEMKELENIGTEPLTKEFTPEKLKQILSSSRRAVKLVLMDQKKIAGIGNIYANEALWEAGIDPRKPANQVKKIRKLHQGIIKVLEEGIRHGGSSAADEVYIKPDGKPGRHQQYFKVYQKEGEPCPRDKTPIKRIRINNRSTFFCPTCQN